MDIDAKINIPWDRIDWNDEQQMGIFRDWGIYYSQRLLSKNADYYYTKALELSPDDIQLLQFRSKCRRDLAQIETAIVDSYAASKMNPQSQPLALEVCDALYEMNRFEDTKRKLCAGARQFTGRKGKAFHGRIEVVEENFKDILGDSLGPFILKKSHVFPTVLKELYLKTHKDMRPLWKTRKEQGKCDVESVIEKEEELLSPREIARRERAFRIYNQIYFNRNWSDVLFLKTMRTNKNLLPDQLKTTVPVLQQLLSTNYGIIKKFSKMLQSRSPLYNENFLRCPNSKLCNKYKESILFRIQNQTRRNMISILRVIRILRATGNVNQLSNFIEDAMGNYVVLKTDRLIPWRLEFMNEVYNTLALAYSDCFIKSQDLPTHTYCTVLYKSRMSTKQEDSKNTFGEKSVIQKLKASQPVFKHYKALIARLERRMRFATYGIERSYLYHEIARAHLENAHYEECCSAARRGIQTAVQCNSYIWAFLCTMSIVKSHAFLYKIERCKEALHRAYKFAQVLKSPELCSVIEFHLSRNDNLLFKKKTSQSFDLMPKRSRFGATSVTSMKLE